MLFSQKSMKPLFIQVNLHILCDFTIQIGGGWTSSWSSVRNLWTEAARGTQSSAEGWHTVSLPQPVLHTTIGVWWGRVWREGSMSIINAPQYKWWTMLCQGEGERGLTDNSHLSLWLYNIIITGSAVMLPEIIDSEREFLRPYGSGMWLILLIV